MKKRKPLSAFLEEVSDEDLKKAWKEILHWQRKGILKDGVVRRVHEDFDTQEGTEKSMDFPVYAIESAFLFEIARRHYETCDKT